MSENATQLNATQLNAMQLNAMHKDAVNSGSALAFCPLMSNYGAPLLTLVRGEGTEVWDNEGRRYLDFLCGLAVTSLAGAGDPKAGFDTAVAELTSVRVPWGGTHRVVGVDALGRVVTSASFPVYEVADTLDLSDTRQFSFAIAVLDADLARVVSWEIHDAIGLLATRSVG